jgi:hypothetical protein
LSASSVFLDFEEIEACLGSGAAQPNPVCCHLVQVGTVGLS